MVKLNCWPQRDLLFKNGCITGRHRGGLLRLDDPADPTFPSVSVNDVLKQKHPQAQLLFPDCVVSGANVPPRVYPVIFDGLQGSLVRSAALRTFGAAGPSGVDVKDWRCLCPSFHSASDDLCEAMAL